MPRSTGCIFPFTTERYMRNRFVYYTLCIYRPLKKLWGGNFLHLSVNQFDVGRGGGSLILVPCSGCQVIGMVKKIGK